ncbi:MAG TPA: hypothetical protein VN493_24910 [Thermoanaerobaculia bacterium]|nr:hypothetical protein [Thermoanaerobaculia bacterium]
MRSSTRSLTRSITALALLAAASTAPAAAQFSQYTAPGSLLERATSKKDQMDQALDNARWRLGPLRLSPWLSIRDAAYVSDAFSGTRGGPVEAREEEPDFTITVGAGLQGYIPFGSKTFFTFDALPQYVWWQELEDRRRLNGYYGAGLFGFFNRLTAQTTVRRAEEQAAVTPEFEQRIHARQDYVDGLLELEIAPTLFVFASAYAMDFRTLTEDLGDDPRLPPFQQLDREERVLRGGVELRYRERLRVAVGAERSEVDFSGSERDRSNSGTSPVVQFGYDSSRLRVGGGLAFRSLEPARGSEFVPFDETTGQLQLTWTPRWRLSYSAYGTRDLTYSLEEGYSHFTADRIGLAISSRLGRASTVNLFGETGGHDYVRSAPGVLAREDDFTGFGTSLQLQFQERVRLSMGVVRSEIDSPVPGFDRSLTIFQTSVEISAFGGAFTMR